MGSLVSISKEIRKKTLECISAFGSGHIGGSLSIVDVLTVLYFKVMNIDVNDSKKDDRDRLVISKGHAGPAVYATLAQKGYIPVSELKTLNQIGTNLPSHCDMNKVNGVDMTTGSLGQGISCAIGIALAQKIKKQDAFTYCIIGDGESQEGQVWEACMFAANKKLDNFICFLDLNHLQIDGTIEEVNDCGSFKERFESFGFDTYSIDGHDLDKIDETIATAKNIKNKPHMIILNTIKGKGVSFIESAPSKNHSMPITKEDLEKALKELE